MKTKMTRQFRILGVAAALCATFLTGCEDPPEACFSVEATLIDQNFPIDFHNCSVFQQKGYQWDFGDGTTSQVVFPTHTFTEQGEYLVSLTSLGNNSQQDDTYSEILKVGKRILGTITIESLPADNNGTPWDAGDDPDVAVYFARGGTILHQTATATDHPVTNLLIIDETASHVDLIPDVWDIIIADVDGVGVFDTMAVFTIDLNAYVPNDQQKIDDDLSNAAFNLLYTLE